MALTVRQRVGRLHGYIAGGFDARWKSRAFVIAMGTLIFFVPLSMFFVIGGFLPFQLGWMSSFLIALGGVTTFLSELRSESVGRSVQRAVAISGILLLVEYVGVHSGFPFGSYVYTEELGLRVAGVPVAISIAWYSTIINTWRIAERLSGRQSSGGRVATVVYAGLLTLALDIALEPMAGFVRKYWLWESNTIPVQNYVSWFVLSSFAVYLLSRKGRDENHRPSPMVFPVALFLLGFHFLLFLVTILVHGYVAAAALAVAIAAIPFALSASSLSPEPFSATEQ